MELINITQANIDGTPTNAVDARELHDTLGVKKAFTTWIKTNLDSIGAEEHKDYMKLKTSLEGSGYKKVVIITTDIAKHLAMMSKTDKGKEIRDYFIEVEKKSNTTQMLPQNVMKEIKLALAGVVEVDKRLDTHHDRLIDLEQNVRLTNQQEYELTQVHHRKVYELAKQYGDDQNDKKLISKLHRQVWSIFKKHFMLPRFNELAVKDFDKGIEFLNNVKLKDI